MGAELDWQQKELTSDSGRVIIHHSAVVVFRKSRTVVASSGPADFRSRDRKQMILRLARSALNQAHSKFQLKQPEV